MLRLAFAIAAPLFVAPAFANEGVSDCCSHDDGVAHCTAEGVLMCKDGKESATCGCDISKTAKSETPAIDSALEALGLGEVDDDSSDETDGDGNAPDK